MLTGRTTAAIALLLAVACDSVGPDDTDPGPPGPVELRAEEIVAGLASPVYLTSPPGDPRLFVVEQPGRIRVFEAGQLLPTPFLDITSAVVSGGERGLLGVAFHPEYAANGFFFVNYTGSGGATRIERYRVSSEPNRADASSAQLILSVPQPQSNHNGGMITFGPDGMLFIGMGDGGGSGDPGRHGQDRSTLLGAMLRIDVDGTMPYAIPADNPLVGTPSARPEIWATGLRNPWRFSFDRESGMLYIADVGQNRVEEINARPATAGGLNYGWNIQEGSLCFPPMSGCDTTGLVQPVFEYDHSRGCSVTGGYVYRGALMPQLAGHYFYADYCRGEVRSFRLASGGQGVTDERDWSLGALGSISSFGEDADGELYVVSHQGRVYRLVPADPG